MKKAHSLQGCTLVEIRKEVGLALVDFVADLRHCAGCDILGDEVVALRVMREHILSITSPSR